MRRLLHSDQAHSEEWDPLCMPFPSDVVPGATGAPLPVQAPETALKETFACAAQVAGTEQ